MYILYNNYNSYTILSGMFGQGSIEKESWSNADRKGMWL